MEREYPLTLGAKIFYALLGTGLFALAIFFFCIPHTPGTPYWFEVIPLFIMLSGILIFISAFKRKVILFDDRIVNVRLFPTKEIFIQSIKGVRIESGLIYIEPLNTADPTLTINSYFELKNSGELTAWLTDNFKNLDAIQLITEHTKLLQDVKLGADESKREASLKKSKRIALVYNVMGVALGIGGMILNNKTFTAASLIWYPLMGLLIILLSNGLIKLASTSLRSICPNILMGFFFPTFAMLIISLNSYTLYSSQTLWLPALSITIFMLILLYKIGINRSEPQIKIQIIIMGFIATIYGFATTLQLNCAFDNEHGVIYKAVVLDHRISTGRHASYYLKLSAWGPENTEKEVDVHGRVYRSVNIGDIVEVTLKKGLLRIPWFEVAAE